MNIFCILLIILIIIIIKYYCFSRIESFQMTYAGTRLCNSRGCDVRYVTECPSNSNSGLGMCLKS